MRGMARTRQLMQVVCVYKTWWVPLVLFIIDITHEHSHTSFFLTQALAMLPCATAVDSHAVRLFNLHPRGRVEYSRARSLELQNRAGKVLTIESLGCFE